MPSIDVEAHPGHSRHTADNDRNLDKESQISIMQNLSRTESNAGTIRRVLLVLTATLVALLTLPSPASAHAGDQSYLYLDVSDLELAGRIEFPLSDIEEVFGIDFINEASDDDTLALIDPRLSELQAYADEHVNIATIDGQDLTLTFDGRSLLSTDKFDQDNNYLWLPFTVDGFTGETPREFIIDFDPFFDEIDGRDGLLVIENDVEGGVFGNEAEALLTYDSGTRTQEVRLGDASAWKNFVSSVNLGVDHIKTGPDHVLFVLVLLIPAVLVFTGRGWQPSQGFGSSLWRVLKIATMFTVAHSITFTLAGLEILPLPPSKFVEAIIAISIGLAALHTLRPIMPNKEWLIAFAFGLFHGMGFATLVDGLDVSRSTQLVSLAGRNVGIEIGQVAVIILFFPALYLLRRTRYYMPFLWVSSLALTAVALGWMYERLAETEIGVSSWIEPVFSVPNIFFYVAGLTAIALAAFFTEDRNGRLIPLDLDDDVAPADDERVPTLV